jgi:hypothetical protein
VIEGGAGKSRDELFPASAEFLLLWLSFLRNRSKRRNSLAAYSQVNLGTEPRPVPQPTRHGHHPSTGDAPSSPAADASDAGANDARNGRDLCPVR